MVTPPELFKNLSNNPIEKASVATAHLCHPFRLESA